MERMEMKRSMKKMRIKICEKSSTLVHYLLLGARKALSNDGLSGFCCSPIGAWLAGDTSFKFNSLMTSRWKQDQKSNV